MSSSTSKRNTMILYGLENDILSHRVRIVLAEKGVSFDHITIKYENPPQELIDINPSLALPTLVDRELVLYGSEIIMEYLDERFPHPPLLPVYPVSKARCRMMIHRINSDWYTLLPQILKGDQAAKKALVDSLVSISSMLDEPPFFMTEEFTLVDCCVAPLFLRLKAWGCDIPQQATGLLGYINKIFKRESFVQSLTATEKNWLASWS
ncbi:stringent starvation protein A [bacterium]|nr:stringent starvation protein A [bacterium]NBX72291.1 stringent starvation protein A [bacterium]